MTTLPTPPTADIDPHELTLHGHTRVDNYYWLRRQEDTAVAEKLTELLDECNQLQRILSASIKTARHSATHR